MLTLIRPQYPRGVAHTCRHSHCPIRPSGACALSSLSVVSSHLHGGRLQLFGHEVILTMIGVTWGIGIGFLIAAAGTIIGELFTY
jgi:hypothetical protein